jgi:pimeloyl-ACP methyl ester carboxylesterase
MSQFRRTLARAFAATAMSWFAVVVAAQSGAPCTIDTRSAPIAEGTIEYNVAGSGPTVLLIHGLFADKEQWNALACRLAEAGYRAVAVDLPGYGKSSGYPLSAYRLERQVDLLWALARHLALDRFDVAGNSMGGTIATLYAVRHPAQVRSLAFLGSPLGLESWHPDLKNAIYRGINPFIPIDESQLELELRLLFVHPPAIPPQIRQAIVAGYVKNNRHYVRVWNIVNLYNDVLTRTPAPKTVTLIVWGNDDHVFPVAGAQRLGRRIAGSEVRRLPDAGHMLHMESADAVAPVYVGFLKTAANAPGSAGLANPASQNCGAKGGTVTIEKNARGDQFGVCLFPDNLQCEEWAMLRGDCRTGGINVTGFVTPAARYCAITGGAYAVVSGSNTANEQGTCTFKGGRSCDAGAYLAGACSR